jgi:hypothetical protein
VGVLIFKVDESGRRWLIQADACIQIADQVLEQADPDFVTRGDDRVIFHCANGDVSYGLRAHDDIREEWLAVRSDVAEDLDED